MSTDKKERLRKLYLLESLVMNGKDEERVEELRKELKCSSEDSEAKGKPHGAKNFDINLYIKAKKDYPNLTDNELSVILDVSPQTIARLKRKNGLCKKQNSSDMRLKRMEQIHEMIKKNPGISKREIAETFGISSALVSKDLNDFEEWRNRYGKTS